MKTTELQIRSGNPQRGIVLLIVLGMLSLFSVLIVTYVVFSSQASQAAIGNSLRREREVNNAPIHDSIINQIVGGGGNKSAAFGQDLLGDIYGVDHIRTRVAHARAGGGPGNAEFRAMLLRPSNVAQPDTTLFKFPLHFATWHQNGADAISTQLANEVVAPLTPADFASTSPTFDEILASRFLPDYRINDAFTGRLVTFVEGPLQGNTFRIVRSFGTQLSGSTADQKLAGSVVIDLSEAKSQTVNFDGSSWNLLALARQNPNALVYGFGPDGAIGVAANATDRPGEFNSDDVGIALTINGVPFNGLGENATTENRVTRTNPADSTQPFVIDHQFGPELLPNRRITGPVEQDSSQDELYDAADFENWFLAWQPSDHRGILPAVAATLASRTGMSLEDARRAAPNIIPSFHRPEVINYLMHKPIWYDDNNDNNVDPSELRAFSDLTAGGTNDIIRLQILIRRLRAATFRPLNFDHFFVTRSIDPGFPPANPRQTLKSDLDGDGNDLDGNPFFSGSHPLPLLNSPIEINTTATFATVYNQVDRLATWLINGPWDVDNDGDGLPDSIWVDLDLPTLVVGNGTVVRPLIAPLIEDLDGRINLNAAGNYAQLTSRRYQASNPATYNDVTSFFNTDLALQTFGRGGGIGPAEIHFSHLFDEFRTANANQPLFHTQTSNPNVNVLRTRYGNLLQSRYGGRPWDYQSPLNATFFGIAHPGANTGTGGDLTFSDPFSRILLGARRGVHTFDSPMGRPMDMYGRSTARKQVGGNANIDLVSATVPLPQPSTAGTEMSEIINQPYEFEIDNPVGDDQPFTVSEFHGIVDQGTGRVLADRLVSLIGEAADSNEALSRLLTFDSRSLNTVELPGGFNVMEFLVSRLPDSIRNNPGSVNTQIQRMLGVELRKSGKLNLNRPLGNGVNDLTTGNVSAAVIDETLETAQYDAATGQSSPNLVSSEHAFPQLDNDLNRTNNSSAFEAQASINASYLPLDMTNAGEELERLTAAELLARNLYCLMYRLILAPEADTSSLTASEFVPNFPYPSGLPTNFELRNHYVARRLAQWAVNVVDIRDTDAIMTRLRFDPNPFDSNGFDLTIAGNYVVWGMERPEMVLTETFALHDRRVNIDLETPLDPMDPSINPDGELPSAIDPDPTMGANRDSDLDQFRIPEASAFVELRSVRDPFIASTLTDAQESFPAELYNVPAGGPPSLDLGRTVGTGNEESPIWRLAVGYTTPAGSMTEGHRRSTLWTQEARRMTTLDPTLPPAMTQYTGAAADFAQWESVISQTTEALNPVGVNSQVHLFDDDLDIGNGLSGSPVLLRRFVWFSNLQPTPALNVTSPASASGMTPQNVFYNRSLVAPPHLLPGAHAVVAPRVETIFGRTEQSTAANEWSYFPSNQKLEFISNGAPAVFSLRYTGINGTRLSPDYQVDSAANYRVQNVLPIIAEARPPHEVSGGAVATGWSSYFAAVPAAERVNIGFNISAPLSGANYYDAPTHRINDDPGPTIFYPLVDGYRNYNAGTGLHADVPFDQRMGAPLADNNWVRIGTHQDISSIFLQRLADPTLPWDATHNPYITVDSMAMDLTVFNGDADLRRTIDHDSNPATPEILIDDPNTPVYPTEIAFDTRRKIPDPLLDRPQSNILLNSLAADPADIANYTRWVYTQRSLLMTRQNTLRNQTEITAAAGMQPHFRHQLMSAWENGSPATNATQTLHSGFRFVTNTNAPPLENVNAMRFDVPLDEYPQTLGFINREFGEPAIAGSNFARSRLVGDPGHYVGFPIAVSLQTPVWFDRPFQSIYDLMSVPATSSSRFAREYDPGTLLELVGGAIQERPTRFNHLLGFEVGIGEWQTGDTTTTATQPGDLVDTRTTAGFSQVTGRRAGFEQIFDLVDIGPLSFGEKKWFDPVQTRRLGSAASDQDQMFNRALQLHQAPFNYTEVHRTPGKTNLNTTPDFIRHGGQFEAAITNDAQRQRPFTTGVNPQLINSVNNTMAIQGAPSNNLAGLATDPFNSSVLYGNGSVYRSIAAGISSYYDLDDNVAEPNTIGSRNGYKQSTESRFGYGFKGFIVGRRGYGTTLFNPSETLSNRHFLNPDLDYRYPTRFAGAFTPVAGSTLSSVQRHMRSATAASNEMTLRRTHDMSLIRPARDFDLRLMDAPTRTAATTASTTDFVLRIETDPNTNAPALSAPAPFNNLRYHPNALGTNDTTSVAPIDTMVSKIVNVGLFERPQAELHKNHRLLDRDPFYRFQNPAYLSGMTTHHSNLFTVRYTIGFFIVDPLTGAFGEEYFDPNAGFSRPRGFHVIDRSIPVGYEPVLGTGTRRELNATDAIIYSYTE